MGFFSAILNNVSGWSNFGVYRDILFFSDKLLKKYFTILSSNENETSFSEEILASTETEQEQLSDLKEFGVDTDEPDLFSSENQISSSNDLLTSSEDENDEDDLEIPAFLRRQKN